MDFARLNEAVFQVRGGIVGNQIVNVEQVRSLTTLPSREVMLGRVIGGIQAPVSSFVGTLAALVRGVMNVLNARTTAVGAASGLIGLLELGCCGNQCGEIKHQTIGGIR